MQPYKSFTVNGENGNKYVYLSRNWNERDDEVIEMQAKSSNNRGSF